MEVLRLQLQPLAHDYASATQWAFYENHKMGVFWRSLFREGIGVLGREKDNSTSLTASGSRYRGNIAATAFRNELGVVFGLIRILDLGLGWS